MTQPQATLSVSTTLTGALDQLQLGLTAEQRRALLRGLGVMTIIALLALAALAVRVASDRRTQEIRLYEQQTRAAQATRRQLQLDLAARASHARLEQAATHLGLVPAAVERVVEHEPKDGGAP